jgi:hypothetical protein
VPTSAPATRKLLEAEAARAGKTIEIETVIYEKAFAHLLAGEMDAHNAIVHAGMDALAERTDAIVLGQISLSRIEHPVKVPVFQVGHSGFREARRLLDEAARKKGGRAAGA